MFLTYASYCKKDYVQIFDITDFLEYIIISLKIFYEYNKINTSPMQNHKPDEYIHNQRRAQ